MEDQMANLKASIDFGLVHIPVEIITAEDRQENISFHMLDSRDDSRIRLKRVNENTGKEVEWDDIVKGYEIQKGKYVTFTEAELKALETESNKSLSIDAFIEKEEITPEMFEMPYFVIPAKGGEKGYAILLQVLEKTEKYAVVQAVLRTREQLGVLYASSGAMMLGVLRYPSELKKAADVVPASARRAKVTAKEISMAEQLLGQMSMKFKPSAYKDNYQSKLKAAIKRKSSKGKLTAAPSKEKAPSTRVIDIMDLLERSLNGAKGKKKKKPAATKKSGGMKKRKAA